MGSNSTVEKEVEKNRHVFSTCRCVLVYQVARSLPSPSPFIPVGIGPRPAVSRV